MKMLMAMLTAAVTLIIGVSFVGAQEKIVDANLQCAVIAPEGEELCRTECAPGETALCQGSGDTYECACGSESEEQSSSIDVLPEGWEREADHHCLGEWDSCSNVCYTMDDETQRASCLHQCELAFNRCNLNR